MNAMSAAIERLRFAVRTLPGVLAGFSEAEAGQRPSPERWTRKEVLGHLIDSASNNHQRFVRGQIAAGQDFPGYDQERWVRIQGYQTARWSDLIELWRAYNTHLLHVAGRMRGEGRRASRRLSARWRWPSTRPMSLRHGRAGPSSGRRTSGGSSAGTLKALPSATSA
jgi:hypothetical protein